MDKMRLLIIAIVVSCAATSAVGQTIKTLGYNTTNDAVVQTQRITFTRLGVATGTAAIPSLTFASGTNIFGAFAATQLGVGPYLGFSVDGIRRFFIATNQIRAELPITFGTTNDSAATRTNLGFSTDLSALWTATNITGAQSAIGLDSSSEPTFLSITISEGVDSFVLTASAENNRQNLGLGLAALTNISNATIMRALSGSTNTNHPYSGSISVVGTNNTNTLVFSNGILQSVQ